MTSNGLVKKFHLNKLYANFKDYEQNNKLSWFQLAIFSFLAHENEFPNMAPVPKVCSPMKYTNKQSKQSMP
jgi:hypothetical protein